MRKKVLCGYSLLARLKNPLNSNTHGDIATAWAAGGKHSRALAAAANRDSRSVKVLAIVGTVANATHPDALEELIRITDSDLRTTEQGATTFCTASCTCLDGAVTAL